MNRREWIRITEHFQLKPAQKIENGVVLAVFSALIVPIGVEIQCIRHARYANGDVFLLPSYRTDALADYNFPKQSFFRIRHKHKLLRFQLALEEALIRASPPGPLNIDRTCMPCIPTATRKKALQTLARNYTEVELARMHIAQVRDKN